MVIDSPPKDAMRFQKLPITVHAIQWDGSNIADVKAFCAPTGSIRESLPESGVIEVYIEHSESWAPCPLGHYVVRDLVGAFYPCEPGVFEASHVRLP